MNEYLYKITATLEWVQKTCFITMKKYPIQSESRDRIGVWTSDDGRFMILDRSQTEIIQDDVLNDRYISCHVWSDKDGLERSKNALKARIRRGIKDRIKVLEEMKIFLDNEVVQNVHAYNFE